MENIILFNSEVLTMSSREIAELTGKRHFDVMKDIERMHEQLGEDVRGCAHAFVHPQNGQQYEEYLLDREHTECLVMGYSAVLRMKVIKRLRELENRNSNPIALSRIDILKMALDSEQRAIEAEQKLAIAEPKVQFVDSYVNASGSLGFRETCKLLHIKENAFRQFLVENEIMYLLAGKLTPYAQHIDAGRFTVKTGENQTNGHAFTQNKFTPKGIQWIAGLWAGHLIEGDTK